MDRAEAMSLVIVGLAGIALLEWSVSYLPAFRAQRVYRFSESAGHLALGIGQQAINIYLTALFLGFYGQLFDGIGPARFHAHVVGDWIFVIFACDLCYYVGHRAAHRINLFVAIHIVHHQAEDYNHVSAMRQSWTAWPVMFLFFLPLAALGVPVEMFAMGQLGIMCVQFLSHNGLWRGSLGPLEWLFITPSNHRVHHAKNRPYVGANCGGMFVLWDRIFGTYRGEDPDQPVVLGSNFPVARHQPVAANLDYFRRLLFVTRNGTGFERAAIWWDRPEVLATRLDQLGYRAPAPPATTALSGARRAGVAGGLAASAALLMWHRTQFEAGSVLFRWTAGAGVLALVALTARLGLPVGAADPRPQSSRRDANGRRPRNSVSARYMPSAEKQSQASKA